MYSVFDSLTVNAVNTWPSRVFPLVKKFLNFANTSLPLARPTSSANKKAQQKHLHYLQCEKLRTMLMISGTGTSTVFTSTCPFVRISLRSGAMRPTKSLKYLGYIHQLSKTLGHHQRKLSSTIVCIGGRELKRNA